MKLDNHTKNILNEDLEIFLGHVERIIGAEYIYNALFSNEKLDEVLKKSAPMFFLDLSNILVDWLQLNFSKIMDPGKQNGNWNLNVPYFIMKLEKQKIDVSNLKKSQEKMRELSEPLKKHRNKELAHMDRDYYRARSSGDYIPEPLFPEGKEKEFLRELQNFCDQLSLIIRGEIWGEYVPNCPGDVLDLLHVLKIGVSEKE